MEPCLVARERMLFMRYDAHEIGQLAGGAERLTLRLSESGGLRLDLIYTVYPEHDIIARKAVLENCGEPITVRNFQSAALCLPQDASGHSLRYLVGKWAGEFQLQDSQVSIGRFTMQSRRGITGSHFNPCFAIAGNRADERAGEVYFGQLAYSGNWKIDIEQTVFGNLRVVGGMNNFAFERTILPGERFESPELVFGFTQAGFSGMSQILHRYQRDFVLQSAKTRRVLYTVFLSNEKPAKIIIENPARWKRGQEKGGDF